MNSVGTTFYSRRDQQRKQTDQRVITVIFDGDKLVDMKGDVTLANLPSLEASTEDRQHGGTVITKPTQREKGLLNRLGIIKPKNVIKKEVANISYAVHCLQRDV